MRTMLRGLRARIRSALFRRAADRDMDDELRFHIDMETEKNLAAGMSAEEARRRALVDFGGIERHRQQLREGREAPLVEPLLRDVRHALRSIRRGPAFAAIAILTIALGVGATTAVYSIIDELLLGRLDVPEANRLVLIDELRRGRTSSGTEGTRLPYERYEAYAAGASDLFTGVAAQRFRRIALRLSDETLSVQGMLTSGNYFEVLGVSPGLGRFYAEGRADEVVVSNRFWRERLNADPNAVGAAIFLDGRPFTVVGVSPPTFNGTVLAIQTDVWVPFAAAVTDATTPWGGEWLGLFGRLAPGVEATVAEAAVSTLAVTIPPEGPETTIQGATLRAMTGLPGEGVGGIATFLALLLAMAMLVLLIASSNLASMLLARSLTRRREVAVRLALGAGRARVVRQTLTESLLLFLAGGTAGVVLAFWLTDRIASAPLPPQIGIFLTLEPNLTVLSFALGVTVITGIAFSLVPAIQAAKPDLVPALRDGGRTGVARISRARSVFVTGQIAMATLLLVVAGLVGRSLRNGLDAEVGFEPDDVVIATTDLRAHGYDPESGSAFYAELLRRVRDAPGAQAASIAAVILLNGDSDGTRMSSAPADDTEVIHVRTALNVVDPTYFGTMGIGLVDGRVFEDRDDATGPLVAVVNETLAERLWPGRTAVGQTMHRGETRYEVIGVVQDGKYQYVAETQTAFAFLSFAQSYQHSMTLHARAPTNGGEVLRTIEAVVRELEPNVAVENAAPMSSVIEFSLFPYRFAGSMVGAFGLVGLLLAVLGVYGVLSFQVAQRTREFGVRRALGADTRVLVRQVVRRGLFLAAVGGMLGLTAGGAMSTVARAFLIGLGPFDPFTFLGVPAVLIAVALVASLVPAVRATSIEAVDALREE